MTKRELATLGVRLMSILAVLYGVHALVMPLGNLIRSGNYSSPQSDGFLSALMQEEPGVLVATFGPFLALSVLALLLWCCSGIIGFWIAGLKASPTGTVSLAIAPSDALILLFSTLGLYLIVTGTPSLVNLGAWLLLRSSVPASYGTLYLTERIIPEALSASSNFIMGGMLLFGGRFIAHLLPSTRPLMTRAPAAVAKAAPESGDE